MGKSFKSAKCKTLLKLEMSRIKLLRNRRDIQVKQMRHDVAQLLGTGQEPSARIRVEHVIREQSMMEAYDMLELFSEFVVSRLSMIDGQKTCPVDLQEAISSLIFAAPRCADLPELLEIKSLFTIKYGKELVAAAAELRANSGVNRILIEKLSARTPSGEMKLSVLKEIAIQYNMAWDPKESQEELLKQPDEVLSGPNKFVGASDLRCPLLSTETVRQGPVKPVKSPAYETVVAAAQAAAESAEHAAAAARAVASLCCKNGQQKQLLQARYKLKDYLHMEAP